MIPRPEATISGTRRPGATIAVTRRLQAAVIVLLATGLVILAATATSGSDLSPNTWGEITLIVIAAALAGVLVVRATALAGWGALALAAFAVLAILTGLSITWSVTPDLSWLEAARTTAYLAAFGSALALARLVPGRWATLLAAIGATAVVLSIWALLVKVLTLAAGGQPQWGRLLAPFGYWNATGLTAGVGMPVLLWAGSRREAGRVSRALAVPGLALLGTVVILSSSRTALAGTIVGLAVPLAFGRTRLRGVLVLGLGAIGTAAICGWALANRALTSDGVALAARRSADRSLGYVLLVALAALAVIGLAAALAAERVALSPANRRRIGAVLVTGVALVPVAGVIALATSSRGLTGEVSHVFSALTSTSGHVSDAPSRLIDLSNSRPRYWRQGLSVGEHHLLLGTGAGSFGTAHLRYSTALLTVTNAQNAHSYVIQTFSDLGLVGLAVSLVLLLSWVAAAARTLSARVRAQIAPAGPQATGAKPAGSGPDPEHDGLWTLLAVVLAFGVSSTFDWTWFYPGLAVPALLCAGWLAGRAATPRARSGAPERMRAGGPERVRAGGPELPRSITARPIAVLGLTLMIAMTIALVWGTWQPLRSADATNAGINAMLAGDAGAAITDARAAATDDPLSLEPLQELAAFYDATGERAAAQAELVKATTVQPQNPLPWSWLGSFELQRHEPRLAVAALRRARALDLTNVQTQQQLAAGERQLRAS